MFRFVSKQRIAHYANNIWDTLAGVIFQKEHFVREIITHAWPNPATRWELFFFQNSRPGSAFRINSAHEEATV